MGDWRFKDGFQPRGKVSAAVVGAVLADLADKNNLTATAYVAASKPTDAPTHKTLEWDNAKAASQFRLVQARTIIRATEEVTLANPDAGRPVDVVVEYVHVRKQDGRGEGKYVPSNLIAENVDEYRIALSELEAKFDSARAAFYRVHRLIPRDREDVAAIISIAAGAFDTARAALAKLG